MSTGTDGTNNTNSNDGTDNTGEGVVSKLEIGKDSVGVKYMQMMHSMCFWRIMCLLWMLQCLNITHQK